MEFELTILASRARRQDDYFYREDSPIVTDNTATSRSAVKAADSVTVTYTNTNSLTDKVLYRFESEPFF